MANMTFKANLLPNSDLEYSLGSSTQRWKVYGNQYQEFNYLTADSNETVGSYIRGLVNQGYDGGWFEVVDAVSKGCPTENTSTWYTIEFKKNKIGNGITLIAYKYSSYDILYQGLLWKNGADEASWTQIMTQTAADDRYVNVTGDTMTGTLGFDKASDIALLTNKYNGTIYNLIRNHNNGNISVSASSAGLYVGYQNTTFLDWKNGQMKLTTDNKLGIGTTSPSQKLHISGGLVAITNNSNTVTIGSQNATFTHIYNSADVPFIFNKDVDVTDKHWLGSTSYPWGGLRLGGTSPSIQYQGTKANYDMIKFIDNTSDIYGNGIAIGGGGQTIIGGGESASTAAAQVGTAGSEIMYVCNDGNVDIISNLQNGWDSRKTMTLNTSGYLMLPSYINVPTGNNENPTVSQFIVTNGNDHYYRKASTAHTMAAIRSAASGSWGINITGSAATATKATQDESGYNINGWYAKEHIDIVDASSLNANTWYPAIIELPIDGIHLVGIVNELNSGQKPSWASHDSGFTSVVELLITRSGWGTTARYTILLQNDQRHINDTNNPPVGYTQFTNSSRACFYVRGGGKYRVRSTWKGTWTLVTSSTTISSQTIAPVTTYPGIAQVDIQLLDRDKYSRFVRAYGAVWNDYAEMRDAPLEPGRCVKEVGDDTMVLTTQRLERGCKIVSDTYGFNIGETDTAKTPIAVSGRALVYLYEDREEAKQHIGDFVCSGPNGTVSIMTTEEYFKCPQAVVGTISAIPDYEEWGTGKVKVNGRIWIYVK